jgi:hypothetical protein
MNGKQSKNGKRLFIEVEKVELRHGEINGQKNPALA